MIRQMEPLVCEEKLREFACSAWRRQLWQAANSSLSMPTRMSARESQLKKKISEVDIRWNFFFPPRRQASSETCCQEML